MTQLEDFLKQDAVASLLQEKGFPVKIEVPIKYTIRAVFEFQSWALFDVKPPPDGLYDIPADFELISRR